jgi:multiple sugar transport system ATP-binding protein
VEVVAVDAIVTEGLTKIFSDGTVAIDDLNLTVESGEFLVVLGPTGCGKSTLLRLVAGLDEPTRGRILLDGTPAENISARDRNVAMVFQDYVLYPHLTVAQNIGFPLRAMKAEHGDVAARVAEAARNVGIADLLNRFPSYLSGGQQQRVAMARAIVRRPRIFLLDEPLSNVDAGVRAELRGEIVSLSKRLGVTSLYVTHDQHEAMSMADRVAVLRRGVLQQVGPPAEVYADPQTIFVAAFLGTPRTNLLEGAIYADPGRIVVDLGAQVLELPPNDPRRESFARHHTERVTVALRTDALTPVGPNWSGALLRGEVRLVENLGHEAIVHLDTGGVRTSTQASRLEMPEPGRLAQGAGWSAAAGAGEPAPAASLRDRLSWLIPQPHHQDSGRLPYGLQPAYDLDSPGDPVPTGEILLRVPATERPSRGDSLTLSVNLDRMLLFDRKGQRIRVP